VVRLLLLLLSMLSVHRPRQRELAWPGGGDPYGRGYPPGDGYPGSDDHPQAESYPRGDSYPPGDSPPPGGSAPPGGPIDGDTWPDPDDMLAAPRRAPSWPGDPGPSWPGDPGPSWPRDPGPSRPARPRPEPGRRRPRRRIPARLKWAVILVAAGWIFRRAIASVVLLALSAALHVVGVNVHLPTIKFAWPWQSITAGTVTNTDIGPWVLQRIEGISKPALGRENFTFLFTHKVSKNIGPWPCWYSSTFYAVGYASATVDLNPGPAWWTPATGHYRLQILSRPLDGKPGHVAVTMVLPLPQLPQSVHDVTIDNIPSKPIATQHSWTYPGFGCGVLIRPQFAQSVLYAQAQQIAFSRSTHVAQITRPLIGAAEGQATQTIRDNFVQPTVNAFGYLLDRFTIRWAAAP
jgi:hypothetical protein